MIDRGIINTQIGVKRDVTQIIPFTEIKHIVPHDLDQELFDKLYGKDVVTTEAEMREKTEADYTVALSK